MNNFLFVSAENDAIPDCKAGGMGDVVRDVPREIAKRGDKVHIVTPAYSRLHKQGILKANLEFSLRGSTYNAELYEVIPKKVIKNEWGGTQHWTRALGGRQTQDGINTR